MKLKSNVSFLMTQHKNVQLKDQFKLLKFSFGKHLYELCLYYSDRKLFCTQIG